MGVSIEASHSKGVIRMRNMTHYTKRAKIDAYPALSVVWRYRLWLTSAAWRASLCLSIPCCIHKPIAALIMKLTAHDVMVAGLLTSAAASSFSRPKQAVFGINTDRYLIELAPGETRWIEEDEKWALRMVCADPGYIFHWVIPFSRNILELSALSP